MTDSQSRRRPGDEEEREGIEEGFGGLTEMVALRPDENPDESRFYRQESLEERRSSVKDEEEEHEKEQSSRSKRLERAIVLGLTVSHLVLMSMVGTIARVALEHLTTYRDAVTTTTVAWPNLAGSLVLGFLLQDRRLFAGYRSVAGRARRQAKRDVEEEVEKTTVPLYVGLAVGFCGSLTSFSSVMGDAYSAATNSLAAPAFHPAGASNEQAWRTAARPGPDGIMALLAVMAINGALAVAGFRVGAHMAIATERVVVQASKPDAGKKRRAYGRRIHFLLEVGGAILGWAAWAAAIVGLVLRRHATNNPLSDRLIAAAASAPPGCLLRFVLATILNRRAASFPFGTFAANLLATAVLGAVGDVQRLVGGDSRVFASCRLPIAAIDGFCGALSTVSTWVAEFTRLRKRHAYVYVLATLVGGLGLLAVVQGPVDGLLGWRTNVCR